MVMNNFAAAATATATATATTAAAAAAAAAILDKPKEDNDNDERPCCCCRVELYPSIQHQLQQQQRWSQRSLNLNQINYLCSLTSYLISTSYLLVVRSLCVMLSSSIPYTVVDDTTKSILFHTVVGVEGEYVW